MGIPYLTGHLSPDFALEKGVRRVGVTPAVGGVQAGRRGLGPGVGSVDRDVARELGCGESSLPETIHGHPETIPAVPP